MYILSTNMYIVTIIMYYIYLLIKKYERERSLYSLYF